MEIEFDEELCTVIAKKGKHYIITPSGESIPAIIFTRVDDAAIGKATVIVKLWCNIKNTEDAD
jgi:hypothetical protein